MSNNLEDYPNLGNKSYFIPLNHNNSRIKRGILSVVLILIIIILLIPLIIYRML
jgi:hypothetical protein